jgi:hypothetical protein
VSGTVSGASEAETDTEIPVDKRKEDRDERLSGLSGAFEDRERPRNLDPVSFDLKPGESATVAELKRRREQPKCIHGFIEGKECYLCDPNHPYRIKQGTAT